MSASLVEHPEEQGTTAAQRRAQVMRVRLELRWLQETGHKDLSACTANPGGGQ